ncbi:hypothetical protein JOL62DRAFT_557885 [Phyllosticta paracitricarpa]|uniref:Uncharacterized protein n=1 Tax=Phyllosticta paracitricarpa TaxID=2016321 RepID=A0ABR1N4B5_9PEZI
MFYDRQSHCFRAHRLLPVSKKSRIPVPLGSRRDPWKDWEEDFRELCDAEATVTQQTWANERLTSWEKDFDVVCGLDCAFEDVAFSSKAIEHDYCDDQTLPSASVDDYLSTSTNESHDCIQRPCDCISSIATTVSTTEVSNNDPESQQTTDPPLTPKFDPDSVLGSSETQQNTDENPQQNIEAILLPEIKEDALGPNRIALQMKSSSLLYDINPQKGSITNMTQWGSLSWDDEFEQLCSEPAPTISQPANFVSNKEPKEDSTPNNTSAAVLSSTIEETESVKSSLPAGSRIPMPIKRPADPEFALDHPGWSNALSPSINPMHSTPPEVNRWALSPAIGFSLNTIMDNAEECPRKAAIIWSAVQYTDDEDFSSYRFPHGATGLISSLPDDPLPEYPKTLRGSLLRFSESVDDIDEYLETTEPRLNSRIAQTSNEAERLDIAATSPLPGYDFVDDFLENQSNNHTSSGALICLFKLANQLEALITTTEAQSTDTESGTKSGPSKQSSGETSDDTEKIELPESIKEEVDSPVSALDRISAVGAFLWDCWNERPLVLDD